jgi:hypothetical protein
MVHREGAGDDVERGVRHGQVLRDAHRRGCGGQLPGERVRDLIEDSEAIQPG